jgi:hypothetical protein
MIIILNINIIIYNKSISMETTITKNGGSNTIQKKDQHKKPEYECTDGICLLKKPAPLQKNEKTVPRSTKPSKKSTIISLCQNGKCL